MNRKIKDMMTFMNKIVVKPDPMDTGLMGIQGLSEDNLSDIRHGEIISMGKNLQVADNGINIGDTLYYSKGAVKVIIDDDEYHVVTDPHDTYFTFPKQ